MSGHRSFNQKMLINEKGVNFDGPLFDLPGGTVKAAVGASLVSYHFNFVSLSNTNASNLILPFLQDPQARQVWAFFTQANIPIFSDQNSIPFFRRLEFEFSWRHDQYSDVKGTSNPKVAFNWSRISPSGGPGAIRSAPRCSAKSRRSPTLQLQAAISPV